MSARFGELLGRLVPLSEQDVAEILEEQSASHQPFGRIALSYGLCQPEHLWEAWFEQLAYRLQHLDLDVVGVDTQALDHLPVELARQCCAIPLRSLGDRVIVAVSEESFAGASEALANRIDKQVLFVLADADQIHRAIDKHYPARERPEPLQRQIA